MTATETQTDLAAFKPRQAEKLTHAFLTAANALANLHKLADALKAELRAAGLRADLVEAHIAAERAKLETTFEL
ncbi:MAG: hypothetical protein SFX18_00555 [Pirellulales bacterium]|nr:hypothetical protein [Pirellulales bacterium]